MSKHCYTHAETWRPSQPTKPISMHVQCKVGNPFFIYSVVDSTLDHLLASSEDGPGVGMGMLEGSGEVIPTAAVYRNDIYGLASWRRLQHALPTTIKKNIYNAIVLPHLDYCSVVWLECSQKLCQELERIQNYGMRIVLSKPPKLLVRDYGRFWDGRRWWRGGSWWEWH